MLSGFEKNVGDFIKANELLGSAERVLLAISGGADSTALLYTMQVLKAGGFVGAELICAHINHGLRGAAADEDEGFVVEQARELGLEVRTRRLDVRGFARSEKVSLETSARQLRIESLLEIARDCGCDLIATAHQKDDNTETVVQRMLRGTGIRGLGGIWPVRVFAEKYKFVRPMLCVRRSEIVEYLRGRNLKWREDDTNADCTYTRNYIRHRLLPVLQEGCSGSLVEQLSDLSQSARRYYSLVCSRADEVWPGSADSEGRRIVLDCKRLSAEPAPVKVELIRRGLTGLGSGERDLAQVHYERILGLVEEGAGGKRVELPGGFVVRREYGRLIFERTQTKPEKPPGEAVEVKIPGRTVFGRYVIEASVIETQEDAEKETATKTRRHEKSEVDSRLRGNDIGIVSREKAQKDAKRLVDSCWSLPRTSGRGGNDRGAGKFVERFDLDSVKPPVVVRFRRAGDRFVPLGLGARKKVGKFLSDARVPQDMRRKTLVVADSEKVIWVWPIRMSGQVKVTGQTRKVLQIGITGRPGSAEGKETER